MERELDELEILACDAIWVYPDDMSSSDGTGLRVVRSMAEAYRHAGVPLLSFEDIDALSIEARDAYWSEVAEIERDLEVDYWDTRKRAYYLWLRQCQHVYPDGRRCEKEQWEVNHITKKHCLDHLDVNDLDSSTEEDRRAQRARMRTADLLDKSLDRLEGIINAPEGEVAPSTLLKAVEMVLDRGGVPRKTSADIEVKGEVTHTVDASSVVADRLAALREALVPPSHSITESPEILDAEVVEPSSSSTEEGAA